MYVYIYIFYIYIYKYSIKGKSLLRRFDKSTTDFLIFWNPWIHWPLTGSQIELHFKNGRPPLHGFAKAFPPEWLPWQENAHPLRAVRIEPPCCPTFFLLDFPQRHEKRISDTFSLNSGWSSLVGMPIFLMDNPTTVLRVSNYKSKYIINQHYWSRDFIFSWQTVLDTSALLVHKSNFGKKMNREHAKFENSQE